MKRFLIFNSWKVFFLSFILAIIYISVPLSTGYTLSSVAELGVKESEESSQGSDYKNQMNESDSEEEEDYDDNEDDEEYGDDEEEGTMITVRGILDQIFAIGGETTGWTIELDVALELEKGMKKVNRIEVDPYGKNINPLKGRHVQVSGWLEWRHGIERGDYPVIVLDSIQKINE